MSTFPISCYLCDIIINVQADKSEGQFVDECDSCFRLRIEREKNEEEEQENA